MSEAGLGRPQPSEYHPYFETYVSEVPEERILPLLVGQVDEVRRALDPVEEARAGFRYAEGKWSIRQVMGHLADTERLFAYRALCYARGEQQPLPGFDEDAYVAEGGFEAVPLAELVEEFCVTRESSVLLFQHLPEGTWVRGGVANKKVQTVRALAYILVGHVRHHLRVLHERYKV
jgi:hypothetical protein